MYCEKFLQQKENIHRQTEFRRIPNVLLYNVISFAKAKQFCENPILKSLFIKTTFLSLYYTHCTGSPFCRNKNLQTIIPSYSRISHINFVIWKFRANNLCYYNFSSRSSISKIYSRKQSFSAPLSERSSSVISLFARSKRICRIRWTRSIRGQSLCAGYVIIFRGQVDFDES